MGEIAEARLNMVVMEMIGAANTTENTDDDHFDSQATAYLAFIDFSNTALVRPEIGSRVLELAVRERYIKGVGESSEVGDAVSEIVDSTSWNGAAQVVHGHVTRVAVSLVAGQLNRENYGRTLLVWNRQDDRRGRVSRGVGDFPGKRRSFTLKTVRLT
jgi:hypothetical protein